MDLLSNCYYFDFFQCFNVLPHNRKGCVKFRHSRKKQGHFLEKLDCLFHEKNNNVKLVFTSILFSRICVAVFQDFWMLTKFHECFFFLVSLKVNVLARIKVTQKDEGFLCYLNHWRLQKLPIFVTRIGIPILCKGFLPNFASNIKRS